MTFWKKTLLEGLWHTFLQLPKADSASHLCKAAAEEVIAIYVYRVHGVLMETQQCLLEDFI